MAWLSADSLEVWNVGVLDGWLDGWDDEEGWGGFVSGMGWWHGCWNAVGNIPRNYRDDGMLRVFV